MDTSLINAEVATVVGSLNVSWSDFAIYCKGKIIEAGINGGITSYTINGRSVTKDLTFWQASLRLALEMSGVDDSGGIDQQPIRFTRRVR